MFECFKGLERRKAAGVDGRTKESYADMEIKQEIHKLVQSMKNNTYRPQPVGWVEIPKENGKKRALGIPTVLDKVVQLACGKIISAIWEPKFLRSSFGYSCRRQKLLNLGELRQRTGKEEEEGNRKHLIFLDLPTTAARPGMEGLG